MFLLLAASYSISGIMLPVNEPTCSSGFSFSAAAHIPFKAPSGWKTKTQDGGTVITPADVPEGKVYTAVLTPLQTKAGTIDEVYEIGKKQLAEIGTYTAISKVEQRTSDGGWEYRFTIGKLEK